MKTLSVHRLGLVPYAQALELQEELAREIARGKRPPTLLLLQHPHTYTLGRKSDQGHLLWSPKELAQRGVELHWVDRGGDITYHGPGQLVGYPLLPLGQVDHRGRIPRADYVGHLRKMEAFLIRALATLGMASGRIPGLSGVWVQPHVASRCPRCPPPSRRRPSKIAALGVKVDVRGISRHGFALNVDTDPTYWEGLVPCGLHDHPVVSLSQLLDPCPSMEQVEEALLSELEQAYALQLNRSGQPL